METNNTSIPYCGNTLPKIGKYYRDNINGYASVTICIIGVILNSLNLLVFTRKTMISPPNFIFTNLAMIDFLALSARIPLVWLKYVQNNDYESETKGRSYEWAASVVCSDLLAVTFQFLSAFLTVMMAIWRYIAVKYPLKVRHWCNMEITRNVVIAGYILCCILLAVPTYMTREILEIKNNQTHISTYKVSYQRNVIMFRVAFTVQGLIARLLPSVVLAGLTFRIVVDLSASKIHRGQLTPSASVQCDMKKAKMKRQMNISTSMLVTVVVLFFIAEFPKGIITILRVIYENGDDISSKLHGQCYTSVVQMFNTITDFNLSITFFVYYTSSQHFKTTFKSLFICNIFLYLKHIPLALGNGEEVNTGPSTDDTFTPCNFNLQSDSE
ncbi:G-protein coupled receptor dmsr-1-like [Planococcus citri]|uniref:G-protein coupled receptor dmsr-1-like n=1 Tax=Planococcus citri TaxID=170843 RepID=UPI0031F7E310